MVVSSDVPGDLVDTGVGEVECEVVFACGGVEQDSGYPSLFGSCAFAVVFGEFAGVDVLNAVVAFSCLPEPGVGVDFSAGVPVDGEGVGEVPFVVVFSAFAKMVEALPS